MIWVRFIDLRLFEILCIIGVDDFWFGVVLLVFLMYSDLSDLI